MKTHKALSKRFNVTRTGKVLKRAAGQDHFNSREDGGTTRGKRRDRQLSGAFAGAVKKLTQK
ncbi:MAG: 50S ribosomal protein L35 [bacterium]